MEPIVYKRQLEASANHNVYVTSLDPDSNKQTLNNHKNNKNQRNFNINHMFSLKAL